jgi:hypothetical protein
VIVAIAVFFMDNGPKKNHPIYHLII